MRYANTWSKELGQTKLFSTDLGNDNKNVIVSSAIFRSVLMVSAYGDEGRD